MNEHDHNPFELGTQNDPTWWYHGETKWGFVCVQKKGWFNEQEWDTPIHTFLLDWMERVVKWKQDSWMGSKFCPKFGYQIVSHLFPKPAKKKPQVIQPGNERSFSLQPTRATKNLMCDGHPKNDSLLDFLRCGHRHLKYGETTEQHNTTE